MWNYIYNLSFTILQAAKQGLEDVVQQHLSLPSLELNAKDDDGYTAVHYAAKFNHIQILKLLLKANAGELVCIHFFGDSNN